MKKLSLAILMLSMLTSWQAGAGQYSADCGGCPGGGDCLEECNEHYTACLNNKWGDQHYCCQYGLEAGQICASPPPVPGPGPGPFGGDSIPGR